MQDLGLPKELQDIFDKNVFGSSWWSELDLGAMDPADVLDKLREQNKDYVEELDLIWENMDKCGTDSLQKVICLHKQFLSLTRESCNDINSKKWISHIFSHQFYLLGKHRRIVSTTHPS